MCFKQPAYNQRWSKCCTRRQISDRTVAMDGVLAGTHIMTFLPDRIFISITLYSSPLLFSFWEDIEELSRTCDTPAPQLQTEVHSTCYLEPLVCMIIGLDVPQFCLIILSSSQQKPRNPNFPTASRASAAHNFSHTVLSSQVTPTRATEESCSACKRCPCVKYLLIRPLPLYNVVSSWYIQYLLVRSQTVR